MQTPRNLDEAKALVKGERTKLATAFSTAIGSRWLLAIVATFALAFASHAIYAPQRLPPVGGLNLAAVGLPPLDLGIVGEQAGKAREAAVAQGAPGFIQQKIDENRRYVPLMNAIGLGLALLVLAVNLTVMTKRRRVTKG